MDFKNILKDCVEFSINLGFNIVISDSIDNFFKGDLDGKNIFIKRKNDEADLFNLLHMVGHSIQWNIDEEKRAFGNIIYSNPCDSLMNKIQRYEWEANCYALEILYQLGYAEELNEWLHNNYVLDMLYLTHFYKTGEKLKKVSEYSLQQVFDDKLIRKSIPNFSVYSQSITRNGIVIDF